MRAIFDRQSPSIREVNLPTRKIRPQTPINVGIVAQDTGVGFDPINDVDIFLSKKQFRELPKPEKREASNYVRKGIYEFIGPPEDGKYFVGVRVTDRVGNIKDFFDVNTHLTIEKPPVIDPKQIAKNAKPIEHTLVVTVVAPSTTDLSRLTKPELTMDPEAGPPTIQGDKYIYSGLKSGVQYTITGKCQLKSGFDKGAELVGEPVRYTFPKKSTRSTTRQEQMKFSRE